MNNTYFTIDVDENYDGEWRNWNADCNWIDNQFAPKLAEAMSDDPEEQRRYTNLLTSKHGGQYSQLDDIENKIIQFSKENPEMLIAIHWKAGDYVENAGTHFYWKGLTQSDMVRVTWPKPEKEWWHDPTAEKEEE